MGPIQFFIPRSLGEALPIEAVKPKARAANVERPTIEYTTVRVSPGKMLITCRPPMARFLLTELEALAAIARMKDNRGLLADCEHAIAAARAAIEASKRDETLRRRAGSGQFATKI